MSGSRARRRSFILLAFVFPALLFYAVFMLALPSAGHGTASRTGTD